MIAPQESRSLKGARVRWPNSTGAVMRSNAAHSAIGNLKALLHIVELSQHPLPTNRKVLTLALIGKRHASVRAVSAITQHSR